MAREGSTAPGTPNGINFGSDASKFGFDGFRYLTLNGVGQIAFWVPLIGGGVDSTNRNGIWATDQDGVLQLIIREGELFEVASGDFRVVSGLSFAVGRLASMDSADAYSTRRILTHIYTRREVVRFIGM